MLLILLIISSPTKHGAKLLNSQTTHQPHATVSQGLARSPRTPILVDVDLCDTSSSFTVCQSLHPQGKGHGAVWGVSPWHWGKHVPSTLLPPPPRWAFWHRAVVLAGERGGYDMLPKLCSRPSTEQPHIPEFSCCYRCHTCSQHKNESISVGKIS